MERRRPQAFRLLHYSRFQGAKQVALLGIMDACSLLFGPEVVSRPVCLSIVQIVCEVAEPVGKAAVLPAAVMISIVCDKE